VRIKVSRNKNYIRPTKNRIQFERLLIQLGYRDRSPIFPESKKKKRQINYHCQDKSAMAVYLFIIPFLTKKSYIYPVFLQLKKEKDSQIKEKLYLLMQLIHFKEKTRIFDVGWEAIYTKQPHLYELKDRKKIIFNILNQFIEAISYGMCGYDPTPGDVLAAKPYGPKINEGFNESSIQLGTHQRYLVAKRVGFGSLYGNGFCYGRYDENLILRPI
jgi:hypothetical protein